MDEFLSLDQYKHIINLTKDNGARLTNCVLLAENIRQKIIRRELYYLQLNNGLLILDRQDGFYRSYYYLDGHESNKRLDFDRPIVIEMPYTKELTEKQILQIKIIRSMGFRLGRESGMMFSLSEHIKLRQSEHKEICTFANQEDIMQIDALLKAYFDPLFAFLPSQEELNAAIKEKRAFVIRNSGGVAAVLICGNERNAVSIKQLVVDSAHRGKGFGKTLMQAYHARYINEVGSFWHWVDMNNNVAIDMYKKFGYQFNYRKANEYVLLPKEDKGE